MNKITKTPVDDLGYNFVDPKYLPKERMSITCDSNKIPETGLYRSLTTREIKQLIANGNTSDN